MKYKTKRRKEKKADMWPCRSSHRLRKCKKERGKEGGEQVKCRRGRRSYSRLLSPFHLQLPLYFPDPSPGAQTPHRTSISTSTSTSSRGICPRAMPASEACIGATAESWGPWMELYHTPWSYHTNSCMVRSKTITRPSSASPGDFALGHNTEALEGVIHSQQTPLLPPGGLEWSLWERELHRL